MREILSLIFITAFSLAAHAQQEVDPSPAEGGGNAALVSKADADHYDLVFTEYDYATMYLDFPVEIDVDVRGVYYINGINNEKMEVKLKRIRNIIPAYTPVLVNGNHNTTYTFRKTDTAVTPITGNLLHGTLTDISVADALAAEGASENAVIMTYGMPKGIVGFMGFYHYTGKKLKANRAFMIYEPGEDGSINAFSISDMDEEDTDGISEMATQDGPEVWHTLQGVRLDKAPVLRGIYIRNGKAVMVK